MKADGAGPDPEQPRPSSAADDRLRLRASTNLDEIVGTALEAFVPGFADAAVVYATESLLLGGASGSARPVRQDAAGRITVRRAGARFAWGGPDADAFPPGEAVVFVPGSPYVRCVNDGTSVAFTGPDGRTLDGVSPGSREVISRYASFLAVPLESDGAVVGLVALAREPVRPAFADGDVEGIMHVAASAGAGIATMTALERHRSVSAALQEGLLAEEPPDPEHVDVAGRCMPSDGALVGGDWYDIVALPRGRAGIVVGDVMGHGAAAAAVMAQLRSAARALALMDPEPAELLTCLNQLITTLRGTPLATCIYAVIDPAGHSCTLSAAGHLPPVLAVPERIARVLDLPSELSLGIGEDGYGQARIRLQPGSVLAFYTDGLVETRTRSFEEGIAVLRTELAGAEGPLAETRDAIIRSLADCPEDDVTLILVRIPD